MSVNKRGEHLQFLEKLKSDEVMHMERLDKLKSKMGEYEQLKQSLKNRGKTLVEIAPGFNAKGHMDTTGPIYVDIGCSIFMEMNEEECTRFCDYINKKLDKDVKHFEREIFELRTKINLALLVLGEVGQV